MSEEERQTIKRLAHSRTAPARTVERAGVWHIEICRAMERAIRYWNTHWHPFV